MSRPVRRATRTHRCQRCGHEATYTNAGAAEARYWFSQHSCRKHEDARVRAIQAKQRMALIDRTPKPCLHKIADHQHGTRAAYVLDKCRCTPCSKAVTKAENERRRLKAYGRYHKYVNAEPVRAHVAELNAYGIGLKRIAKLSGVSTGTLSKLMYGVYAPGPGGRNGKGDKIREPSARTLRSTAEKIYAIEPTPANLSPNVADPERTPAARLHLRALVALGWSINQLGERIGVPRANAGPLFHGDRLMTRATVDRVETLYDDLSMTPPVAANRFEQAAITRSKRYAAERGWVPPLALDDDDTYAEVIDSDVDEAVVLRILDRDLVPSNRAEREEVVRRWTTAGRSLRSLEVLTGWPVHRYTTGQASGGAA